MSVVLDARPRIRDVQLARARALYQVAVSGDEELAELARRSLRRLPLDVLIEVGLAMTDE